MTLSQCVFEGYTWVVTWKNGKSWFFHKHQMVVLSSYLHIRCFSPLETQIYRQRYEPEAPMVEASVIRCPPPPTTAPSLSPGREEGPEVPPVSTSAGEQLCAGLHFTGSVDMQVSSGTVGVNLAPGITMVTSYTSQLVVGSEPVAESP